ncbi:hypothetical protein ACFPM0_09445 [Pseudonocardia sulfidoxydans]|uniref:hypothetical protein n=1 Tax=Pseudonocardia sulfidoxydans TaxID=54011 RepID=UPI0036069B8C
MASRHEWHKMPANCSATPSASRASRSFGPKPWSLQSTRLPPGRERATSQSSSGSVRRRTRPAAAKTSTGSRPNLPRSRTPRCPRCTQAYDRRPPGRPCSW